MSSPQRQFFLTLLYGYIAALVFTLCLQVLLNLYLVIGGLPTADLPGVAGRLTDFFFAAENRKPAEIGLYLDIYYQEYAKILASLLVATLLCLLLFVVSYLLSFSSQREYEKSSEYECGFDPFDNATRQPFEVHFYIVGILFLIFDVEVALLFPWAVGLDLVGSTGFWSAVVFLIIITLGFIYEWKRGALA